MGIGRLGAIAGLRRGRSGETNYKTDVTRRAFEAKLRALKFKAEPRPDGEGTNYFLSDGARYFVRDKARTHEGPTADYFHADGSGKIDMN